MAKLSGIEIYKLLPRTNCKDCGVPTCMAFAMQVASQKTAIDGCPHVTDEACAALGAAQTPPMATVKIGTGFELGGETVLYRHEGRFLHPPLLALRVSDTGSDEEIDRRIEAAHVLQFDRLGQTLGIDGLAVVGDAAHHERFLPTVKRAASKSHLPLILLCEHPEALAAAALQVADRRPLIGPVTDATLNALAPLAIEHGLPLLLRASSVEDLASLSQRAQDAGIRDLVLDPEPSGTAQGIARLAELRWLALEGGARSVGYPSFLEICGDSEAAVLDAIGAVARYGSVIVVDTIEPWAILAIVTARMNLFTDPQVPNAVEARLHEIGTPGPNAPVLFTTNFALTYFTVAGEVENSKVPSFISVMDTGGLGVLNAYADLTLTAESVVEVVRAQGAMDRVDHNLLIIPGLIARLRMAIQEASGWDVLVGPEDAGGIPRFLNTVWAERDAER